MSAAFAERCFQQIEGFGEYGFPESHAASFALLVYASAWLKCRYPDVFAAALMNAQPMGFYAPAQIVRDAREHGVAVSAPDVQSFGLGFDAGAGSARGGASARTAPRNARGPAGQPTRSASGCARSRDEGGRRQSSSCSGASAATTRCATSGTHRLAARVLERLADADAFGSLSLTRRDALWAAKALGRVGDRDDDLPLFGSGASTPERIVAREPDVALPPMPPGEEVVNDYRFLRLSLRAHPAQFLRDELSCRGIVRNEALRRLATGARVTIAGLVTCRQRPGSANGVVFMTIEDEKRGRQCDCLAKSVRARAARWCSAPASFPSPAGCSRNPASFTSSPTGSRI